MTYFTDLSIFPGELSAVVSHYYGIMLQGNQPQLKAAVGHWGFSASKEAEMLSVRIPRIVQQPF